MARTLDSIVVVEISTTGWDGCPPPGQVRDIIEIGACLVDARTLQRREPRRVLVRPTRSIVGPYCTRQTSVTPDEVADAGDLKAACRVLRREFDADRRPWATYGDETRRELAGQCADHGLALPFGPTHFDVKILLGLGLGLIRPVRLAGALERLGLTDDGTGGRAADDAWQIAAVLARVFAAAREGMPVDHG